MFFLLDAASGMKSDQRPVDLRKRLKTAAGLQLLSRSKRKGIEDMTYTIENDIKKPRKAAEDFTQIKYTVKNVKASKSPDQRRSKAALAGQSRLAGSGIEMSFSICSPYNPVFDLKINKLSRNIALSPTRWHDKHTYLSSLGMLGTT